MAENTGPAFDPGGAARSVLQSAVADFGARVLSNPAIVDGICDDRLPEWPREASLISTAARADVADLLQQQAGGIGADTAVRLTAGTLAESRSLDPAACVWVVSEFARALGYHVSDGLPPAGHGAPGPTAAGTGAAGNGAAGNGAAGDGGAGNGAAGDAVTTPPDQVGYRAAPSPGADPTVLPGRGDGPASGEVAALGHVPTVTSGPPLGAGAAPPGPGGGLPAPPGPPPVRPGGPSQKVLLAGGAAAILVLYLILAGATHLPPFGKATPTPSPTPPASPSPASPSPRASSPVPTPAPSLTVAQRRLAALIPASVSADSSCRTVSGRHFGSVAEFACSGAPNVSAGYVDYYLFGTPTVLNQAYLYFLSHFAHATENSGPCNQVSGPASFRRFAPCETSYSVGRTSRGGRVMEYRYKGTPDISTTYTSQLLLVDMGGNSNGNTLLGFWDHNKWLKSG